MYNITNPTRFHELLVQFVLEVLNVQFLEAVLLNRFVVFAFVQQLLEDRHLSHTWWSLMWCFAEEWMQDGAAQSRSGFLLRITLQWNVAGLNVTISFKLLSILVQEYWSKNWSEGTCIFHLEQHIDIVICAADKLGNLAV